jgi:hypothetical protein
MQENLSIGCGWRHCGQSMITLVQQVMRRTKARVFHNDLHASDKLVNLFETEPESAAGLIQKLFATENN